MFYELLRPIPTHTEGPSDFKRIVITLVFNGVCQIENTVLKLYTYFQIELIFLSLFGTVGTKNFNAFFSGYI